MAEGHLLYMDHKDESSEEENLHVLYYCIKVAFLSVLVLMKTVSHLFILVIASALFILYGVIVTCRISLLICFFRESMYFAIL